MLQASVLHLGKWSSGPWSSEDPDAALTFLLEKPETQVSQHAQSKAIHFESDMKGLCKSASLPGAAPL